MILLDVSGASAIVRKQDILTSGMVGAKVVFCFDEDWDNLAKTAVFRAGKVTKDAIVVDSISEIPHEVLAAPGVPLEIGVYGTADNGSVVIPTVWAKTYNIKHGTDPSGDESLDPTLPVWAQMQEQIDTMYKSSEEIYAAMDDLMQTIEEAKDDLDDIVAAGGYYSKLESNTNFASAIKGKLSGAIVSAKDVSSIEHTVAVKAHSKNLINNTDDFVKPSGIVHTFVDGVLEVTGGYVNKWIRVQEGETYTFSCISTRTGTSGGGVYIRMYAENQIDYKLAKDETQKLSPVSTFTTEKGYPYVRITFYGSSRNIAEESATYSNIQLEEGTEATAYEPYIDPSTAKVTRYGSNLIKYPFSYTTRTTNGVTFTPKADGTLVVSGTATANTYFALNGGFSADKAAIPSTLKAGEEYTITGAMLFLYSEEGTTQAFNAGTFTMPDGFDYYGIFIYVPSGTTISTIIMPQLEHGNSATEFKPYNSTNYSALADGTIENVLSLSPGMTLVADTAGILLDVEYNRDSNVVLAELLEKIAAPAILSATIE